MQTEIQIERTDSANPDFQALVKELDFYLAEVDGDLHEFYHQYNHIDALRHCVVARVNGIAAGTGAIRPLNDREMEVKRMYVSPELRQSGIGKSILAELEKMSLELGYEICVLETGIRQQAAIALYTRAGYKVIPNYGQYEGVETSVCMQKRLL